MLISLKKISSPIQRLAAMCALAVWFAFAFCFQIQSSTAQKSDIKFREFDRNMVHSPRELARDLKYLFFDDKKNPLADIDPEKLKKLRELGTEFLKNLSDEEKKQAQEFAEKFLKDKGLDSPEGKLLMDSLGVSPEMQSELAKEFGEEDFADMERFRDLLKGDGRSSKDQSKGATGNSGQNRTPESSSGNSRLPGSSSARPEIANKAKPGDSRLGDGKMAGGSKPGTNDPNKIPPDLFESLPNELDRLKGKSPDRLGGELSENGKRNPSGKNSRDSESNGGIPGGDIEQAIGDLTKPGQLPPNASNDSGHDIPNRGKRGQGKSEVESQANGSGSDGPDAAEKGLAGKDGSSVDQEIEGRNDLDVDKRMAEILAELNNKKRSSEKKLSKSPGSNPKEMVGDAQAKQGLDETFKSWIQMEAIKKRIREYQQKGGPSDFQRRSLESAFKRGFKGLGDSLGDTLGEGTKDGLSKSEFKDKFDRVLFDAARDSADLEQGADEDSDGVGGAVGSTLDGILDRVSKAAKDRQERKQEQRRQTAAQNHLKQIPLTNDDPFGGDSFGGDPFGIDDLSSDGFGTDALGSAADMLENIPELPAFDPQKILIFAAIVAAVILLLYFLVRNYTVGSSGSAARKFGRSFQAAKIRSPKDLVEAVDYFIVQKFGNRARWWNARHAQEMLCAGAPGYSAKISDLLKDYVRARYMRPDLTLSAQQQLSYKNTLRELSKEVPAEQQMPADASLDEG